MSDEALERLRRENPVPGQMAALPIEPVLARLDREPPVVRRPLSATGGARRALSALPAVASLAVVIAVVAVVLTVRGHGGSTHASSPPSTSTNPLLPSGAAHRRPDLHPLGQGSVPVTPLELFQRKPVVTRGPQTSQPQETVIPSTVRELGTFTVTGVGRIQYWVADTRQHGICGALRLANGDWAGLGNGGPFTVCYPTRRQIGAGALIIDGFDYFQVTVPSHNGQRWYVIYGAVSANAVPVVVLDTVSKRTASLVRDGYFAIALHPVGNDYGDDVHLEAFDASGQRIATQGHPLPATR